MSASSLVNQNLRSKGKGRKKESMRAAIVSRRPWLQREPNTTTQKAPDWLRQALRRMECM